jgi:hypothetical protein
MPRLAKNRVGIHIDALTNSIVNTISGDSFPTEVYPLPSSELKLVSTKKGWIFDWASERKQSRRRVFKLTIRNNPDIIQGLVSISDNDTHFYLHLIESAPFNLGKNKLYEGVPGNLFAFTCKTSWDNGYQGFVSFASKTRLIEHYEKSLGATHIGGNKMVIYPHDALKLIHQYYPELK